MADNPTPQPEIPPLERLNALYEKKRAKDRTIARYDREIARARTQMRTAYHMAKVARLAQRAHEKWIKEEAAAELRKLLGIKTIPGFASTRESAQAFRQALTEKQKLANAAARKILAGDKP